MGFFWHCSCISVNVASFSLSSSDYSWSFTFPCKTHFLIFRKKTSVLFVCFDYLDSMYLFQDNWFVYQLFSHLLTWYNSLFLFGDGILLCWPCWPQTHTNPSSTSPVLGLQAWTSQAYLFTFPLSFFPSVVYTGIFVFTLLMLLEQIFAGSGLCPVGWLVVPLVSILSPCYGNQNSLHTLPTVSVVRVIPDLPFASDSPALFRFQGLTVSLLVFFVCLFLYKGVFI